MKVFWIGLTELRRMLRDRSNIFFVFILPLAIILLVGSQFGEGGGPRVVIAHPDGDFAGRLIGRLEQEELRLDRVEDEEAVAGAVERGSASAGIVLPEDIDSALAEGRPVEVGFVSRADSPGSLQPILAAAVSDLTADVRVAVALASATGAPLDASLAAVSGVEIGGVEVRTERVGEALFEAGIGQFSVGAAQQVVLFVFLTALTGSAALIQSRQLGVTDRMLTTPTSVAEVIAGMGTGRFLVGVFQGLYIIVVTLVAFGVDWGDPLGWVPLLLALSATGAGAAMLLGSLFSNDQQAGGFSVLIGLGMAAMGGAMLPLELFSPTMRTVAHVTPHAWAVDGFADLVYRGGSFQDVMKEVGILLLYAAVLLGIASWRLRRRVARA